MIDTLAGRCYVTSSHSRWPGAGELGFVCQFRDHLDRVDSMFASFGPTLAGGSIGWSGRESAHAVDAEG
jgi:hypothetical protein